MKARDKVSQALARGDTLTGNKSQVLPHLPSLSGHTESGPHNCTTSSYCLPDLPSTPGRQHPPGISTGDAWAVVNEPDPGLLGRREAELGGGKGSGHRGPGQQLRKVESSRMPRPCSRSRAQRGGALFCTQKRVRFTLGVTERLRG